MNAAPRGLQPSCYHRALRTAVGLYFEDFDSDRVFVSAARTIDAEELAAFAAVSGDSHPLHVDRDYASNSMYGRIIAQGSFVFSASIGLTVQMGLVSDTLVAFYGVDQLRFAKPVYPGDTLTVEKRVASRREAGRHVGLVTFDTVVRNQHGQPVLVYHDTLLLRRRVD